MDQLTTDIIQAAYDLGFRDALADLPINENDVVDSDDDELDPTEADSFDGGDCFDGWGCDERAADEDDLEYTEADMSQACNQGYDLALEQVLGMLLNWADRHEQLADASMEESGSQPNFIQTALIQTHYAQQQVLLAAAAEVRAKLDEGEE